jgi:hypothetical protein
LNGWGSIQGNLTQSGGKLLIGDGRTLMLNGSYTQNGGTLTIQASGPNVWGLLAAQGDITLAGNLAIALLGGYNPAGLFTKVILTSRTQVTGAFSSPVPGWDVDYSTPGQVKVIKQP